MSWLQAVILGLVQGLTEFIPVSSSAHLVLVPWLFGWPSPGLAFDTVLHLGTLAAVLGVFWRDFITLAIDLVASLRRRAVAVAGAATADVGEGTAAAGQGSAAASQSVESSQSSVAWALIIGTIPAVVLGLTAQDFFEALFDSPQWVAVFLLVTAFMLWAGDRWARSPRPLVGLGPLQALFIGLAQGLAIAPGISRSGATISAGRLTGLSRPDAARFSFLLATPAIAGAGALQVLKLADAGTLQQSLGPLLLGFAAAAVSGYLVIRFLLNYLREHSLNVFAVYCAVAGVLGLVIAFLR